MRIWLLAFCAVPSLLVAGEPPEPAPQPPPPRASARAKWMRGWRNVARAPLEIPVSVSVVAGRADATTALTSGVLAGLLAASERLTCGVLDIVTAPFPLFDRPPIRHKVGESHAVKAAINAYPGNF